MRQPKWWWIAGALASLLIGIGGWYSFAVQHFANQDHAIIYARLSNDETVLAKHTEQLSKLENSSAENTGKLDMILDAIHDIQRRVR